MVLDAATFYRLRVRLLETRELRAEFDALIRARETAALIEAGLDPAKVYRLEDETLTATVVEPNAV